MLNTSFFDIIKLGDSMNIGIDIDDTLIKTREYQTIYWREFIKEHPNETYTEELPDNINTFGDPYIDIFWDIYRGLLFSSPFKENTSEVLKKLKQDGFNIYIITARRKEKYANLEDKIISTFIENDIPYDGILTDAKDKGKCMQDNNIDILIDDEIYNCESAIKYGKKAILFNDRKEYTGLKTTSWLELYDMIIDLKNRGEL